MVNGLRGKSGGNKSSNLGKKDSICKIDWDFGILLLKNRTENILSLAEFALKLTRFQHL